MIYDLASIVLASDRDFVEFSWRFCRLFLKDPGIGLKRTMRVCFCECFAWSNP